MTNTTTPPDPTDTPAYNGMKEMMHGQAMGLDDALSGEDVSDPDPDPESGVLNAISEGRTVMTDTKEHVSTLASLGYSIDTAADALDMSVEEVESVAEERLRELMRVQLDESNLPSEETLWQLHHIIYREEYVHFLNVAGTKDVAAQIGWDSLVTWIEETIETAGSQHDYTTWIGTLEEAIRHEEAD